MKKLTCVTLVTFCLVGFLFSCRQEEHVTPAKGNVTFAVSPASKTGGRVSGTVTPAFVLLNITDSEGKVQENVKLSLFAFGSGYMSDNLELPTGPAQLTKFAVLDATNEVVYATPTEGSVMAKFVSNPLPIAFTVTEEGTQVIPEVLAIEQTDTPASFGYASFGFDVVKIAAITLPLNGTEQIIKVSYQFSNGTQTISSDVIPSGSSCDFTNPDLFGKTWQTRIVAWTNASDCNQKVYRYKGELTFNGSAMELPSLDNNSWVPFYYTEKEITTGGSKIGIFRSVDPRKSYTVELQLPSGVCGQYGYVDRGYWNEAGDQLCDLNFSELSGCNLIEIHMADQACSTTESYYQVDSFLTLNLGGLQQVLHFEDYFVWEVTKDVISPLPCTSGGRITVPNERAHR